MGQMTGQRSHATLWALFFIQVFCAVFFALDAVLDFLGLEGRTGLRQIDTFEYFVAAALFIGVFFNARELRQVARRCATPAKARSRRRTRPSTERQGFRAGSSFSVSSSKIWRNPSALRVRKAERFRSDRINPRMGYRRPVERALPKCSAIATNVTRTAYRLSSMPMPLGPIRSPAKPRIPA